jgi:hypothetical protein
VLEVSISPFTTIFVLVGFFFHLIVKGHVDIVCRKVLIINCILSNIHRMNRFYISLFIRIYLFIGNDDYAIICFSGLKSNSYQLTNENTDNYQTPFNGHANYNELLSNPFQSSDNSRGSGQGYQNPSMGRAYTPFKADKGMPGNTGMSNPGGNPFNQAGSQMGRGN